MAPFEQGARLACGKGVPQNLDIARLIRASNGSAKSVSCPGSSLLLYSPISFIIWGIDCVVFL